MARITATKLLACFIIGCTVLTVYRIKKRHQREAMQAGLENGAVQMNQGGGSDNYDLDEGIPDIVDVDDEEEENGEDADNEEDDNEMADREDELPQVVHTEPVEERVIEVDPTRQGLNRNDFAQEDEGIPEVPEEYRPDDDIIPSDVLPELQKDPVPLKIPQDKPVAPKVEPKQSLSKPVAPNTSVKETPKVAVPVSGSPYESGTSNVPKVEPPKVEAPKAEAPKVEMPKIEAPKADLLKKEQPKVEMPKVEAPKADLTKKEQPKVEIPKIEPTKEKIPPVEVPKAPTPAKEPPKTETSNLKVEVSKEEIPKVEPPKLEPPKQEVPKVEAPKEEKHKVEVSKSGIPKVEAPKLEPPKLEPPKPTPTPQIQAPKMEVKPESSKPAVVEQVVAKPPVSKPAPAETKVEQPLSPPSSAPSSPSEAPAKPVPVPPPSQQPAAPTPEVPPAPQPATPAEETKPSTAANETRPPAPKLPTHLGGIRDDMPPADFSRHTLNPVEVKLQTDWDKEQADRVARIEGYCTGSHVPGDVSYVIDWSGATQTWSGNYMVDDIHKVIFCTMPKTGSTYLKMVFANLTGRVQFDQLQSHARLQTVHRWDFLRRGDIYPLNENSPDEIQYKVRNYKKFMFARDPIERFVNAYRDKLEEEIRLPGVAQLVLRHAGKYQEDVSEDSLRDVSFTDFVNWFTTYGHVTDNWNHFYLGCVPCFMDYDYIGHVEHLERDLYNILMRLYSKNVADSAMHTAPIIREATEKRMEDTHNLVNMYLGQLMAEEKNKLYDAYVIDRTLFEYGNRPYDDELDFSN